MISPDTSPPFKAFRQFNEPGFEAIASSRTSVDPSSVLRHFPSDTPADVIARALGETRATSIKELVESFEFFHQTRKHLRARHIIDLCCGHGLTGMLYGVLDRKVESVTLVDQTKPLCVDIILDSLAAAAPWVKEKVRHLALPEKEWSTIEANSDTSLIGVHACGPLTDRCLDFAIARGLPVAVMPCCYPHESCPAPSSVRQALGAEQAYDVHRTYHLEQAGYRVKWRYIPGAITPMNRILIGKTQTGRWIGPEQA
jgi:hypothetical protein